MSRGSSFLSAKGISLKIAKFTNVFSHLKYVLYFSILKVDNILQVSRTLESFDVEERPTSTVEMACPNVKVIHKAVASLDADKHVSNAGFL